MYPDISKIKQVLLRGNYISEEESAAAEKTAQNSSQYIDTLVREELLTKTLLGQALAEAYNLRFIEPDTSQSARSRVSQIPESFARPNRVVIAKTSDDQVTVVTDTPSEVDKNGLKLLFPGKEIVMAYTLPDLIDASLVLYSAPLETRFSQIISGGKRVAPEIINQIISDALSVRASDIHFEPQRTGVQIRFRIDGILRPVSQIAKEYYINILNRIKVESGMRIDEHRSSQDGAISFISHQTADLRVSLVPTIEGETIVMRILDSGSSLNLTDIGLSEAYRKIVRNYATQPFGMLLTVGPTGSGKTTTLYSLLKILNQPNVNITTIEDPVEYKIAGINQIQVREEGNMTFVRGLKSIVRQDPDIILVGEIRDRQTAEISVNAALSGHLLLSTFPANDAAAAIPRLLNLGVEPFLLASTLELIIAQRLVRKICEHCRYSLPSHTALKDSPDIDPNISKFFPRHSNLYAGKGCNYCNNTGFKGRTALFEILQITPEMQDLIVKSPSAKEITTLAKKQAALSLFDDGMDKVRQGITTLSEVLRVVKKPWVS